MRVVLCRSRLSVRRSPAERRLLLRCHVRHSRTEFRCVKFTIMGAHRHGQRGGGTCSPWKCCSVLALVLTVKRSVDQLFMHYFHNLSSASGRFAPPPDPHRISTTGPRWWTFIARPPNLPTPKKSCGRPCSRCAIRGNVETFKIK